MWRNLLGVRVTFVFWGGGCAARRRSAGQYERDSMWMNLRAGGKIGRDSDGRGKTDGPDGIFPPIELQGKISPPSSRGKSRLIAGRFSPLEHTKNTKELLLHPLPIPQRVLHHSRTEKHLLLLVVVVGGVEVVLPMSPILQFPESGDVVDLQNRGPVLRIANSSPPLK